MEKSGNGKNRWLATVVERIWTKAEGLSYIVLAIGVVQADVSITFAGMVGISVCGLYEQWLRDCKLSDELAEIGEEIRLHRLDDDDLWRGRTTRLSNGVILSVEGEMLEGVVDGGLQFSDISVDGLVEMNSSSNDQY